jgi:hypothetical protein
MILYQMPQFGPRDGIEYGIGGECELPEGGPSDGGALRSGVFSQCF